MSNPAPKSRLTYVAVVVVVASIHWGMSSQRRAGQEGGSVLDVLGGQYDLPSRLGGLALFSVRWDEDWQKPSGVSSLSVLVLHLHDVCFGCPNYIDR